MPPKKAAARKGTQVPSVLMATPQTGVSKKTAASQAPAKEPLPDPPRVPRSAEEWSQHNAEFEVEDVSIFDFDNAQSASKIRHAQFLTLRTLVSPVKPGLDFWNLCNRSDGPVAKVHIDNARVRLKALKSWGKYLASIEHGTLPGDKHGTFAVARYLQMAAAGTQYVAPSETTPSPGGGPSIMQLPQVTKSPSPQPDGRLQQLVTEIVLGDEDSPDGSEEDSEGDAMMLDEEGEDEEEDEEGEADEESASDSSSVISSRSVVASDAAKVYSLVNSEDIANSALVALEIALAVFGGGTSLNCYWSPARSEFDVKKGKRSVYKARIDAALVTRLHTRTVIAEVKSYMRFRTDAGAAKIVRQEAAEVAAWLHCEPPTRARTVGPKDFRVQ